MKGNKKKKLEQLQKRMGVFKMLMSKIIDNGAEDMYRTVKKSNKKM